MIIVLCLWFGTRDSARREHNQKVLLAVGTGVLLCFGVAELFGLIQNSVGDFWARPYDNHTEAEEAMELLFFRLPDSSFPSNAMCGIAPIATGLWFAHRRASILVWGLVLLWGFGRVYVGIHYPLDVVGGIALGIVGTLLTLKLMRTIDPLVSCFLRGVRRVYLA